jgi:hypothetical protein
VLAFLKPLNAHLSQLLPGEKVGTQRQLPLGPAVTRTKEAQSNASRKHAETQKKLRPPINQSPKAPVTMNSQP